MKTKEDLQELYASKAYDYWRYSIFKLILLKKIDFKKWREYTHKVDDFWKVNPSNNIYRWANVENLVLAYCNYTLCCLIDEGELSKDEYQSYWAVICETAQINLSDIEQKSSDLRRYVLETGGEEISPEEVEEKLDFKVMEYIEGVRVYLQMVENVRKSRWEHVRPAKIENDPEGEYYLVKINPQKLYGSDSTSQP